VWLTTPTGQILFLPFDSAFFHLNILTDPADSWIGGRPQVVKQLGPARLASSPFPLALLFHIAPFPVSARIIDSFIVAHFAVLSRQPYRDPGRKDEPISVAVNLPCRIWSAIFSQAKIWCTSHLTAFVIDWCQGLRLRDQGAMSPRSSKQKR